VAEKDTRHERRNEQAAARARPPADRSYGESASDQADPAEHPDPQNPDTRAVREGYDATAESTTAAPDLRTSAVPPPDDDSG
jgi:hypothetical protein